MSVNTRFVALISIIPFHLPVHVFYLEPWFLCFIKKCLRFANPITLMGLMPMNTANISEGDFGLLPPLILTFGALGPNPTSRAGENPGGLITLGTRSNGVYIWFNI